MPRIDAGPLTGEEGEALVEPGRQRLDADRAHPRRRQLDRQRQPVEPPADLGHRPEGAVVELEPGPCVGGAVGEQLDGGGGAGLIAGVGGRDARAGRAGARTRLASPSGSRPVASTVRRRQRRHSRWTNGTTASRTCSQLSSSSRTGRSWMNSSIVRSSVRCWRCSTSKARGDERDGGLRVAHGGQLDDRRPARTARRRRRQRPSPTASCRLLPVRRS